jgi:hypothetical protein
VSRELGSLLLPSVAAHSDIARNPQHDPTGAETGAAAADKTLRAAEGEAAAVILRERSGCATVVVEQPNGEDAMRTVVLAILIALPLAVVSSHSVQAAGAKKPDAEYCGMGECFPQYITSITKDHSGLIIVRTRMEHYCMPGNSCNSATHDPPKTLTYKVQCKTPGGYIETDGQQIPEPEREPPHATQTEKELWTLVCSRARRQ